LPMKVRQVVANEKVSEDQGKVALEYGPMVYCAEEADNGAILTEAEISAQSEFSVEKRNDLLNGVISLVKKPAVKGQSSLVLIPYYAWSNRGVGQMKVWFPLKKD
ncbi:MAG: glycoside hydrolase family 127 protein, partial [Bacteroidales bacterium]|nr:glycoside hydrolase family 127 protein [Bacteroidales bacterium]